MRRTAAVAAGLALVLLVGGCSGGDDSPSASNTTTGRSGQPSTGDPFCDFFRDYSQRFGRIDPRGGADPAALRAMFQEATAALREAQTTAPEVIRADVGVLNNAFQQFVALFEQANYDFARLQVDAFARISTPEFVGANQRIDAYIRQNCG